MAIETDVERRQLLADFGVTCTYLTSEFKVAFSEDDGYTMDSGVASDGIIELLAVSSDVADAGLTEGKQVTISGNDYKAYKIDSLCDGMDILYCEAV